MFICLMVLVLMITLIPNQIILADQTPKNVRVLLTAFQSSNSLKIEVYGNYALDDKISFQRGSELTVYLLNGQLMLHYEGMSYSAGSCFKLVRHYEEQNRQNGRRSQGENSLYTGDLQISVKDNKFYPVLNIPIEEYLQGVVPMKWPMISRLKRSKPRQFPRAPTLAHLKPDKDYDLVDNTNDQVFRGIKADKENAIKAVKETAGIVCMYKDKLAVCLYTASNGGLPSPPITRGEESRYPT